MSTLRPIVSNEREAAVGMFSRTINSFAKDLLDSIRAALRVGPKIRNLAFRNSSAIPNDKGQFRPDNCQINGVGFVQTACRPDRSST